MLRIDQSIMDINNTICGNLDQFDFGNMSRALISQNLLSQSRNLVEHIAVKIYARGQDVEADWDTIPAALESLKHHNKYQFLRKFHSFLQESKSHYTPSNDGAERLVLKYYQYYLMLRTFMLQEFKMSILENLEKFPLNTDRAVQIYHEKIAEKLEIHREIRSLDHNPRLYVHKVVPFAVRDTIYYEIVLTPAWDTTSKFDRFVCYSKIMVPAHYSARFDIYYENIEVEGKRMPVNILVDFQVSIRPCELNNYGRIFGESIEMKTGHSEYIGMMQYLTQSGSSLLDVILSPEHVYLELKRIMFGKSKVHYFENILDKSRHIVSANKAGANIIRYLLHTLNNKVLKNQWNDTTCWKLSDLNLQLGCIPFDEMPFATSLLQHNPDSSELFGCINPEGREHEFLARYLLANMTSNAVLYTPFNELEEYTVDINQKIVRFNDRLYGNENHQGRRIEKYGKNVYIRNAYKETKLIIEKLLEFSSEGIENYEEDVSLWLLFADIDSEEKRTILQKLFAQTKVSMVYGSAGTGKTYLINHVAAYLNDKSVLFLANTNPAVENLRRKVTSAEPRRCEFLTIRRFLTSSYARTSYDLLVMDECSMVSNTDMAKVLQKIDCELMILVGDTYQIESIAFGNWFSMAKYFLPRHSWNELEKPYRTRDQHLLEFWSKVRGLADDLTEYIVNHRYSANLDASVFDRRSEDEIILCLNYDGMYGINNINRLLQENNPSIAYRWGLWTFKVGDPVLFNESERFMPVLYNNLKGRIVNIELDAENECIWFSIEVEKEIDENSMHVRGLEVLEGVNEGCSIVRFLVKQKNETDDDNSLADETDIPFQLAYAVSIHKAQGLEYDSVKVIITEEVDELITHNIFYTAITRSRQYLKIYWSPETQEKVIRNFSISDSARDAAIFSAQSGIKKMKYIKK